MCFTTNTMTNEEELELNRELEKEELIINNNIKIIPAIYIPTKNNPEMCKELYDNLRISNIPLYLCMDKSENTEVFKGYNVICPEEENKGIGYARNHIIRHAKEQGYTHILQIDDDIRILFKDYKNIGSIFEHFKTDKMLGQIGFNQTQFGKEIKHKEFGLFYTYCSATMAFALDVDKVLEVGNFDKDLRSLEDFDLPYKLMHSGYYRALDKNLFIKSVRKCKSKNNVEDSIKIILKKYPIGFERFFSKKKTKSGYYYVYWNKMLKAGHFNKLDLNKIWKHHISYRGHGLPTIEDIKKDKKQKRKSLFED